MVPTLALAAAFGILAVLIVSACCLSARCDRHRKMRAEQPPIDLVDGVVAVALAGACCEPWWASAGAEHAPHCRHARDRAS
jgi:hypothetical protein